MKMEQKVILEIRKEGGKGERNKRMGYPKREGDPPR